MAALLLGLAAAVGYGAADFLGGWVSRRDGVLAVVIGSQMAGLALLLAVLAPLADGLPTAAGLGWGGAAGATVGVGLPLYYRGLTRARMGVVAPVAAVVTATLPVCVGLALGEQPSVLELAGVLVAVVAVGLVSLTPAFAGAPSPLAPTGPPPSPPRLRAPAPAARARSRLRAVAPAPGILEAVGAGLAFGLFFVCMDRTGPGPALWPLSAATLTSLGLLGGVAATTGQPWRPVARSWPAVAAAGLCGTAASLGFLLAVRRGLLSLVSVLASLSPAATVALARVVVGERLTRWQLAGLAAAVAGVALIAAG